VEKIEGRFDARVVRYRPTIHVTRHIVICRASEPDRWRLALYASTRRVEVEIELLVGGVADTRITTGDIRRATAGA